MLRAPAIRNYGLQPFPVSRPKPDFNAFPHATRLAYQAAPWESSTAIRPLAAIGYGSRVQLAWLAAILSALILATPLAFLSRITIRPISFGLVRERHAVRLPYGIGKGELASSRYLK